jgi:hypothetical protein
VAAPALSAKQKQTRMSWARRHQNWMTQQWSKVSYSLVFFTFKIFNANHFMSLCSRLCTLTRPTLISRLLAVTLCVVPRMSEFVMLIQLPNVHLLADS